MKKTTAAAEPKRFECEHDLHIYLLHNLEAIEPGLRLYGRDTMDGLQFKCLGKKLDLLAEQANGDLLAIELKYGDGRSDNVGQLFAYMAVIRRLWRFAGRNLRGLLICRKATEHLLLAAEDLGCISVSEYTQEPRIEPVLIAHAPIQIPSEPAWR
jgi:RecB family endonuclease NucS